MHITQADIQTLLDTLYEAISFPPGEEPHFDALLPIFLPGAKLVEYTQAGTVARVKSIEAHVEELQEIFQTHPLLKAGGFSEASKGFAFDCIGPIAHVKSRYRKVYTNGGTEISGEGMNGLQVVNVDGKLKIASLCWFE